MFIVAGRLPRLPQLWPILMIDGDARALTRADAYIMFDYLLRFCVLAPASNVGHRAPRRCRRRQSALPISAVTRW